MKSRSTIFLIIGSVLIILFELNGLVYNMINYADWVSILIQVIHISIPAGFILLGLTFIHPNPGLRQKIAPVFTAMSALSVLIVLYFRISYAYGYDLQDNVLRFALDYLMVMSPVSLLLFWIFLMRGNLRRAAVWLLAGALLAAFSTFSGKLSLAFTYGYRFGGNTWLMVSEVLRILNLLFPIALASFALSILKSKKTLVSEPTQPFPYHPKMETLDQLPKPEVAVSLEMEENQEMPSVIDWISDFLAVLIPVFGVCFLIWRGQDKTDRYRRNWATATLFWTIIGNAFLLWIYSPFFKFLDRSDTILWLVALFLATLFIFWLWIVNKISNDDFDDHEKETVPSILTWTGWTFLTSLPIAGLIMLIIWATDAENRDRKTWAIARLIWIGIMIFYWLFLYSTYAEIASYNQRYLYF